MLGGIKIQIKKSFDYRKIGEAIRIAKKSVPAMAARSKVKSEWGYNDVGSASTWWIDDKKLMHKLYFDRIQRLNQLFLEAKYRNFQEYYKSPRSYLTNPAFLRTLQEMDMYRTQKHQVLESFEDRVKKAYDDRTIEDGLKPVQSVVDVHENIVKPCAVGCSNDLVVNDGMERFALLICNESNTYFTHYAIGASVIPAGIGQSFLFDERARAQIDEFGWFSSIGTLIRGGSEFPETIASFGIAESAAVDSDSGGNIAWRTSYSVPVQHTQNSTFPVASHVVYQVTAAPPG